MKPQCVGCKKTPDELTEYTDMVLEGEAASADKYVMQEEGTYNRSNGHFLCTLCYIKAGMPSSPQGWVCP